MINLPGIGKRAPDMRVKKERAQNLFPKFPSKYRLLPAIPKAHADNALHTSINGHGLLHFSQSLDTGRRSQASQLPSLSSSFSLPDLPTAPDGLVSPSLSLPEGVGERRELEKQQVAQNLPVLALALTPPPIRAGA